MSARYDWRDLATTASHAHQLSEREVVMREVLRLHALGRTPRDIGLLTGLNDSDVVTLIYGPETVA